ncbi:hypothetical protein GYMLUDRAFT_244151 [Collybiopsis luxurians FD-317 M1]|uniref:AAA+ ATPase domain-containing protein n=1 Tax=Collybiopsis luxurians FD-317 M1 TaxID=944289 RepID=A0A0D0CP22_9AGAR|nr:hypothetical protein GYMLUDRAFT_244151 [Collybiopsis luxurians FD-317 M1]
MAALVQRAKISSVRLQHMDKSKLGSSIQFAEGNISPTRLEAWEPLLEKLSIFAQLTATIAEVHPYAQAAYSVISLAYQAIQNQVQRDINIISLVETMDDIYAFVKEAEPLRRIESHKEVMNRISQQTVDCGYFISAYCADPFLFRAMKHALLPTDAAIVTYGQKFSELKAALLARSAIHTEIAVLRTLEIIERLETKIDLSDLPYAKGARFQSSECCLAGTRKNVLNSIISWIDRTHSGEGGVFILKGGPGTGKSAIAHSVASHYFNLQRLGSSIFADLPDEPLIKTRLPVLLLPTIARDLADLDPQFQHALWEIIKSNRALRQSLDPTDQLKSLIIAPIQKLAISGPIVIVLDALDGCPDSSKLHQFFTVLGKQSNILPFNFRVLLTTRPDSEMLKYFHGSTAVHIQQMEDFDQEDTNNDLLQLAQLKLSAAGLNGKQHQQLYIQLVKRSQGSFRWLVEACDSLCRATQLGQTVEGASLKLLDNDQSIQPKRPQRKIPGDTIYASSGLKEESLQKGYKSSMK